MAYRLRVRGSGLKLRGSGLKAQGSRVGIVSVCLSRRYTICLKSRRQFAGGGQFG